MGLYLSAFIYVLSKSDKSIYNAIKILTEAVES